LAASAAAGVNLTILLGVLRRREGRLRGRQIAASLARIILAACLMGAGLEAARRWLALESARGAVAAVLLFALIFAAGALYWATALVTGAPEPAELRAVVRRRR
jgi:peptidoglycan biosynthesis protein MviN/MurJ (putative lipid II flippase)